jgi:hypothetical protein
MPHSPKIEQIRMRRARDFPAVIVLHRSCANGLGIHFLVVAYDMVTILPRINVAIFSAAA